jgi:hemerythrin-like domain-containing protein
MDHKIIPQQVLIEHEILANVTDAMRAAIGWKYPGEDLSRKLSSLRFVAGSFKSHLDRLFELEEHEGYIDAISRSCPRLRPQLDALRLEHGKLRDGLAKVSPRLDAIAAEDRESFSAVCDDLLRLLHELEEHNTRETNLIEEALLEGVG